MWDWFDDSTPAVREACRAAVRALEEKGAMIVPIAIPHLGWFRMAHASRIITEFALGWDARYHSGQVSPGLEPNTRITVGLGSTITAVEALAIDRLRAWLFDYVKDMFAENKLTALVTPTLPMSATLIPEDGMSAGESNNPLITEMMKYIFMANFLGLPGISVPVAWDKTNSHMPIGLQFMAPWWRESDIIRLGAVAELGRNTTQHPVDRLDMGEVLGMTAKSRT
eukprot:FR738679.1.p1 GENE.FR738679.1~~FR738679.1.p1  ORF type:complete len:225 (+),score=31.68 FR738679.1:2-676(+)